MTELDHLRKLLDEAEVSYLNRSSDITIGYYTDPHTVTEAMDGSLQMTGLTAEQAMRALEHPSNCTNSERMSDELKPCPFCGGEAFMRRLYMTYIVDAKHDDNCPLNCRVLPYDASWCTRMAAQSAWNRRVER